MTIHHAFHAYWTSIKKVTKVGHWQDGKMPKTGPNTITLRRPLRFGNGFRWCFVEVESKADEFRILVSHHQEKRNFSAYLFQKIGNDQLLLARLENHGTHPGVHLHACCIQPGAMAYGRTEYPDLVRCPPSGKHHRNQQFPTTDVDALHITGVHFNLPQLRQPAPRQYKLI